MSGICNQDQSKGNNIYICNLFNNHSMCVMWVLVLVFFRCVCVGRSWKEDGERRGVLSFRVGIMIQISKRITTDQ